MIGYTINRAQPNTVLEGTILKKKGFLAIIASLVACAAMTISIGDTNVNIATDTQEQVVTVANDQLLGAGQVYEIGTSDPTVPNMYRSELTNEWISTSLRNQRPVAIMVDNERTALPHFGVNKADVVYEMMNSTANGRITRLMCVVKDWGNLTQFGSIRSIRPTNFFLATEWNAILVHDGGPACHVNPYYNLPQIDHLSGGFARFSNGKRTEFTEYVTSNGYRNPNTGRSYAGLTARIASAGFTTTYNQYYTGNHWTFSDTDYSLNQANAIVANEVDLPFPHNSSKLIYNPSTGTYDYYEYGSAHVDPLDGNKVTSFKNVIIQSCSFAQLDAHGYMIYNILATNQPGYYLTNGKAIPIAWSKTTDLQNTQFVNTLTGTSIVLNTGKTYIGIVPSDVWTQLVIK